MSVSLTHRCFYEKAQRVRLWLRKVSSLWAKTFTYIDPTKMCWNFDLIYLNRCIMRNYLQYGVLTINLYSPCLKHNTLNINV